MSSVCCDLRSGVTGLKQRKDIDPIDAGLELACCLRRRPGNKPLDGRLVFAVQ